MAIHTATVWQGLKPEDSAMYTGPTPNDLFLPVRLCLPKAPVPPKPGPKLGTKDSKC